MRGADEKYRRAIELYRDSDLTLSEISRRCGVSRSGLAVYIQRKHRDLMAKRNGISDDPKKRMRSQSGQRPETRMKYREAIEACDSKEYLNLNISQIARMFNLDGAALANQLRAHYPDILQRRDEERYKRGLTGKKAHEARKGVADSYAEAVELLRNSDLTIKEAAEKCGVSFSGLRQHILFYHKDLVEMRNSKREEGKQTLTIGGLSGNGRRHEMSQRVWDRYAEGMRLYMTSSLTVAEIARRIGVNENTFRDHLRRWYK